MGLLANALRIDFNDILFDRLHQSDIIEKDETIPVKGEPVTSYARVAICPSCGEEIGDSRLENANTQAAYDIYRERYGIISPTQILTRVLKSLFIADFLSFEKRGQAITGITYARMPHGPMAVSYRTILDTAERDRHIQIEDNACGKIICPINKNQDITDGDMAYLQAATTFVSSFTTVEELSEATHALKLWSSLNNGELIRFEAGDEVARLVSTVVELPDKD
ncbi:MAG: DUF4065 domain-containing protein [Actinomycetia bacterium]|nr:DUF4065 domain-containing protein [Actinomycetes bacterium]